MEALYIRAFGKLQMQSDGKVVTSFPTHHVEELLGYLLLNQRVLHSREKLISILWPEGDLAQANGRFSTVLWRLRCLFTQINLASESYLQATRSWLTFTPERPLSLDLDSFIHYMNQARATIDVVERERAFTMAVHFYQGELYQGIDADWCLIERERLARLRLYALGQLMAGCMQRNTYEEAITLGQTILQEDPLREEVHRAIMYCYWQMGQGDQAVRQFYICAQELRQALHIEPMAETIAMYHQIVQK